jgi:putative PIN family toxin of toxin-antitoxin system
MLVVLDTNVVISALLFGGKPLTFLESAAAGNLLIYTSPTLLEELHDVLKRDHLASQLKRKQSSVDQAVAFYSDLAISVTPLVIHQVVTNDPDDDHVIAVAVAAQAEIIVSGDKHLLTLGMHQAIRILNPADALVFINERQERESCDLP